MLMLRHKTVTTGGSYVAVYSRPSDGHFLRASSQGVDEVLELLERHPICRRARRCQLFIADLWKSDPNMAATNSHTSTAHFLMLKNPSCPVSCMPSSAGCSDKFSDFHCVFKNLFIDHGADIFSKSPDQQFSDFNVQSVFCESSKL